MSSPRVIIQVAIVGAQILGRALRAAGRQAVENAKATPGGVTEEAAGVRNAAGDSLTQTHRMTIDEAHLILNVKKGETLANALKNYELLFKANSPVEAPTAAQSAAPVGSRKAGMTTRYHSHYLQSKVVRARERIEAEFEIQQEAENAERLLKGEKSSDGPSTPPPPSPPPA